MTLSTSGALSPHKWEKLGSITKTVPLQLLGAKFTPVNPRASIVFSLSHLRQPSSATQAISSELGSGIHLPGLRTGEHFSC